MIYAIPLALFAAGLAFVAYKGRHWDHTRSLFDAQQGERLQAAQFSAVLLSYFDRLDSKRTGLLTAEHMSAIDALVCSPSDKALLRDALSHAGPRVFLAPNPWMLAPMYDYTLTAIGHVVGKRKEQRVATAGVGMHGGGAYSYSVEVDAYGISKADLGTYVARVNARKTLTLANG